MYSLFVLSLSQVMETKNMLYLVTEYAKNGEIFGEYEITLTSVSPPSSYTSSSYQTKSALIASGMFLTNKEVSKSY